MPERIYVVIPCYNEEEVLPETSRRLLLKLRALIAAGEIDPGSRVMFVDDGSRDKTWAMIERLSGEEDIFSGLRLSRNRGHQNALLAGLMAAKDRADISISMDADLQDDVDIIDGFLAKRKEGCDVVYGVRSDRASDTAFKRMTAQGFYRLMKAFGVELIYNHADCRLMSRRALEGLSRYGEVNLFLRGIVPLIGYRTGVCAYERAERFAGESKYPLKKMLAFAFDGITSFSVRPLDFIRGLGLFITVISLIISVYSLFARVFAWPFGGWGVLMGSLWFLSGLNLLALGLTGSYIGKIYAETKRRPRYFVEELLDD
ncbi:MAG: glycosyltransferase family 2 protein [Oscillospiraceae bacterium]|nr:glycosyltransferase family 2 protein [Oscillospiraceae bacterium]